jgi:hypothetical protein
MISKEKIQLRKTNEELEAAIAKNLDLNDEQKAKVHEMLQYNMLTTNQVSDLTGLSRVFVQNKLRPRYKAASEEMTTELDFCYPFSDFSGIGPKFIVRNKKLDELLRNPRKR